MKIVGVILILFLIESSFAQVGINTTDPQEMLHVNGKIRVDDVTGRTSTSVLGVTSEGTLNKINVAGALEIHNNTIVASGTGYYSVVDIELDTPNSNTKFNNLDLGLDDVNTYKTLVRFYGQTNSFEISGIEGGIEGRHIVLLNSVENVNMTIMDDHFSDEGNRILTYGSGPFEASSGQGVVEMVYDGTHWIVINFRN